MNELVASGSLHPKDLVWRDGLSAWQPAGSVPEFFPKPPPVPRPAPREKDRIAYVRGGRFRRPHFCVGCMARDPSRRTSVTAERLVVGSGPDVLGAMGVGLVAGGLVGAAVGGLIASGMEGSALSKESLSFEFPICRACLRREEETFFNRAGRLVECTLHGNDLVFVFANLEYAEAFREDNRLGPPPRGFVLPTPAVADGPAAEKPAPSPPEDSPFANLDGDTNKVVRSPRRNPRR
jgi:hypothetical protein